MIKIMQKMAKVFPIFGVNATIFLLAVFCLVLIPHSVGATEPRVLQSCIGDRSIPAGAIPYYANYGVDLPAMLNNPDASFIILSTANPYGVTGAEYAELWWADSGEFLLNNSSQTSTYVRMPNENLHGIHLSHMGLTTDPTSNNYEGYGSWYSQSAGNEPFGTSTDTTRVIGGSYAPASGFGADVYPTCVYEVQNVIFDTGYYEPDTPYVDPSIPDDTIQLDPQFTANFTGLKAIIRYHITDNLPVSDIKYNFDGGSTFTTLSNTIATTTPGFNDLPLLSTLAPPGYLGDHLGVDGYFINHDGYTPIICNPNSETDLTTVCFQEVYHTFPNSTRVNIAVLSTDSVGHELTTTMDVVPGGTGGYQNGTGINATMPIEDLNCKDWFTDPICNIKHIVVPNGQDWLLVSAEFDKMTSLFREKLGFLSYPFTFLADFYTQTLADPNVSDCHLQLGTIQGQPYTLDFCIIEDSMPTVFSYAQMFLIGISAYYLLPKIRNAFERLTSR